MRLSPETRPVDGSEAFSPIPQWAVAELRKVKACVLMLTQFLGTRQRIRFFFLFTFRSNIILAVYFETALTLSVDKMKKY